MKSRKHAMNTSTTARALLDLSIRKGLTKRELIVFNVLFAQTICYGKDGDAISNHMLTSLTGGLRPDHVYKARDSLINKGIFDAVEDDKFDVYYSIPSELIKDSNYAPHIAHNSPNKGDTDDGFTAKQLGQLEQLIRKISAENVTFSENITPDLGEKSPDLGEKSPDLGEKSPDLGKKSPVLGETSPVLGETSPVLGETSPVLGEHISTSLNTILNTSLNTSTKKQKKGARDERENLLLNKTKLPTSKTLQNKKEVRQNDEIPLAEQKAEYSEDFTIFWKTYPKRKGGNNKKLAWKNWKAQIKKGTTPVELITAAKNYHDEEIAAGNVGTRFVKMTSTFLGSSDHWKEYQTAQADKTQSTPSNIGEHYESIEEFNEDNYQIIDL